MIIVLVKLIFLNAEKQIFDRSCFARTGLRLSYFKGKVEDHFSF